MPTTYLEGVRKNSPYLRDCNDVNVLELKGSLADLKEAAITIFHAWRKADQAHRKEFFLDLINEVCRYAIIEYDWKPKNVNDEIAKVMFESIGQALKRASGW
jgi:hypothetical protein